MNISQHNGTLSVTGLRELNSGNARLFQATVAKGLSQDLRAIEIDLSEIHTVDGAGLGALVSLFEMANEHQVQNGVAMRLTNPKPTVQQIIELARLHHWFEIAPSTGRLAGENLRTP